MFFEKCILFIKDPRKNYCFRKEYEKGWESHYIHVDCFRERSNLPFQF